MATLCLLGFPKELMPRVVPLCGHDLHLKALHFANQRGRLVLNPVRPSDAVQIINAVLARDEADHVHFVVLPYADVPPDVLKAVRKGEELGARVTCVPAPNSDGWPPRPQGARLDQRFTDALFGKVRNLIEAELQVVARREKSTVRYFKKTGGGAVDNMEEVFAPCNHRNWQGAHRADKARKALQQAVQPDTIQTMSRCAECTGGGFWMVKVSVARE